MSLYLIFLIIYSSISIALDKKTKESYNIHTTACLSYDLRDANDEYWSPPAAAAFTCCLFNAGTTHFRATFWSSGFEEKLEKLLEPLSELVLVLTEITDSAISVSSSKHEDEAAWEALCWSRAWREAVALQLPADMEVTSELEMECHCVWVIISDASPDKLLVRALGRLILAWPRHGLRFVLVVVLLLLLWPLQTTSPKELENLTPSQSRERAGRNKNTTNLLKRFNCKSLVFPSSCVELLFWSHTWFQRMVFLSGYWFLLSIWAFPLVLCLQIASILLWAKVFHDFHVHFAFGIMPSCPCNVPLFSKNVR